MPFSVNPSKDVVIDFANVEHGDHLLVTMAGEANTQVIITAFKDASHGSNSPFGRLSLRVTKEHLPLSVYTQVFQIAQTLIQRRSYELQEWYKALEKPTDLYTELVSAILDGAPATVPQDPQIGRRLEFSLNRPFGGGFDHTNLFRIKSEEEILWIKPTDHWTATLEAGLIRAERELNALRVH